MKYIFFSLLFLFSSSFADHSTSGTLKIIQQQQKNQLKKPVSKQVGTYSCPAEAYYNNVLDTITTHFHIFYTLEGPHATTNEFVDTLATYLEKAWKFHTIELGMHDPKGMAETYHYEQTNDTTLYPVEILDIDLLRDTDILMGGSCHGCFGLTYQGETSPSRKSEMMVDNDFKFTPTLNSQTSSVSYQTNTCSYSIATEELTNEAYNYSYAEEWNKGIKVTAYHELYHAVQSHYLDFYENPTFWLEASAVGIEEISAPEINDYWSYLPSLLARTGTPLDEMPSDYSSSIFFLYLYNNISKTFDTSIWESFEKEPEESYQTLLVNQLEARGLDPDSVFHDFATDLLFTNNRSVHLDSSRWISADAPYWDAIQTHSLTNIDDMTPDEFSYNYFQIQDNIPDITNTLGKISVALWNSDSAKALIYSIESTRQLDSLQNQILMADTAFFIVSRLQDSSTVLVNSTKDKTIHAYPTPWRGETSLCFTPLPDNKKFIEIRNRIGTLVTRISYDSSLLCLEGSKIKKLLVPGLYYFRAGSNGKVHPFIIIY